MNIYDFNLTKIDGKEINTSIYKNKVLLIVNVASKCGFTKQYSDLENLYRKYKDKDFIILGFPCNQFFREEPGSDEEILNFCKTKYDVTFDMFSKIEVNGKNANPFYVFLKDQKPWSKRAKNVKWNFEKFLVNKKGDVVERFSSKTKPEEFENKIVTLL